MEDRNENLNDESKEDEVRKIQEYFVESCVSFARETVRLSAEKHGLKEISLQEMKNRYSILIGESSEEVKRLIDYCQFLEENLIGIIANQILAREMEKLTNNTKCDTGECSSCKEECPTEETGEDTISFDFENKKEED